MKNSSNFGNIYHKRKHIQKKFSLNNNNNDNKWAVPKTTSAKRHVQKTTNMRVKWEKWIVMKYFVLSEIYAYL